MISSVCFTRDWIDHLRGLHPGTDPGLLEKTMYAFELLGILTRSGIPFIFKGGTALMLHIPKVQRLSIDVDIIGQLTSTDLEKMIKDTVFIDVEEDIRGRGMVPKKHFMVFYESPIQQRNQYILLDVINIENPYTHLIQKSLYLDLFKVNEELTVQTPTLEGLLGDKLAAFAPDTIGVPYGAGKSMEIIKQLFDIGKLYEYAVNFDDVRSNHRKLYEVENSFRNNAHSYDDVLRDTIQCCYLLCQLNLRGSVQNEKTEELQNGVQQIRSHLFDRSFNLGQAKVFSSRAALMTALLKGGPSTMDPFESRFNSRIIPELEKVTIEGRYSKLNRLKPVLPEAFYYWHLISQWENV